MRQKLSLEQPRGPPYVIAIHRLRRETSVRGHGRVGGGGIVERIEEIGDLLTVFTHCRSTSCAEHMAIALGSGLGALTALQLSAQLQQQLGGAPGHGFLLHRSRGQQAELQHREVEALVHVLWVFMGSIIELV